jgi:hypothetical protein
MRLRNWKVLSSALYCLDIPGEWEEIIIILRLGQIRTVLAGSYWTHFPSWPLLHVRIDNAYPGDSAMWTAAYVSIIFSNVQWLACQNPYLLNVQDIFRIRS